MPKLIQSVFNICVCKSLSHRLQWGSTSILRFVYHIYNQDSDYSTILENSGNHTHNCCFHYVSLQFQIPLSQVFRCDNYYRLWFFCIPILFCRITRTRWYFKFHKMWSGSINIWFYINFLIWISLNTMVNTDKDTNRIIWKMLFGKINI